MALTDRPNIVAQCLALWYYFSPENYFKNYNSVQNENKTKK